MSNGMTKMKKKLGTLGNRILVIRWFIDFTAILVSYFAALWIRFDCKFGGIQKDYLQTYFYTAWIYAIFCVVVFWFLRLYKSI